MKISSEHVGRILGAELRSKDATGKADKAAARPDQVTLSARASDLQTARRALDNASDVRQDKVADLRQQIEQGTYHVDSKELAGDVLRELAR